MRKSHSYPIDSSVKVFKDQLLSWSQQHDRVVWLDSNFHEEKYGSFEAILAIGNTKIRPVNYVNAFNDLEELLSVKDWLFGYFAYDLKNELEALDSKNHDGLAFPHLYFFRPQKVIKIVDDHVEFQYLDAFADEIESDHKTISTIKVDATYKDSSSEPVKIKMRIHKDAYFQKANRFLRHIKRGDIYEANFCQEFYAENTSIDPLTTYRRLNKISSAPFAAFMKFDGCYLLSASPERYLKKVGNKVISQPIKGTAARSQDVIEDEKLKIALQTDPKERSENIMITDLVRNDLSHFAKKGSVRVEELCEVYSFNQVHQLISTVTAQIKDTVGLTELIKNTFPMGSMTGAPKVSAMKIIEELEESKRGLYSGAVGYFDPNGNFDFNVVIRSILYNQQRGYVSYSVGSAITAKSNPDKEYQECLLKAKAMREVLCS